MPSLESFFHFFYYNNYFHVFIPVLFPIPRKSLVPVYYDYAIAK